MDVFTQLTRLQFRPATASVHSGADLQVELTLRCLMPISVHIQQLAASIHFDLERGGTNGRSKGAQRQKNAGTVEFCRGNLSAGPPSSAAGPSLELDEMQDRSPSDNSLSCTGVVCKNTHLVMRRHDSNSPPDTPNCLSPPAVPMKEGAQMLKVHDVTLEPGNNSIVFTAPVRDSLMLFQIGKKVVNICLTFKRRYKLCLLFNDFMHFFPHLSISSLIFLLANIFSATHSSPFRANSQELTRCVSCMPRWVTCSLCCPISTHRSSMKSILRSPTSTWSLSLVRVFHVTTEMNA